MSVPKYEDFSKTVTAVFDDDYTTKNVLKVKTKTAGGVIFNIENERASSKGKVSVNGKVGIKYAHSSGIKLDKLQMKPDGGLAVELVAADMFSPGFDIFYKGDAALNGSAGVNYKDEFVNVKLEADLPEFEAVGGSLVATMNDFYAGGIAKYGTGSKDSGFVDYNIALGYKQKDYFASAATESSMSVFKAMAFWNPCPPANLGLQYTLNPEAGEQKVSLGTTYACNPKTKLRAKADTDLTVSAAFSQQCAKNLTVVGSATIPKGDFQNLKYGVTINLG